MNRPTVKYMAEHKLNKIQKRGLQKATEECLLSAMALNLKRLAKCPICGSTNVNKITIGSRAAKTAVFGVLGAVDDAGKTYKCGNCGSRF